MEESEILGLHNAYREKYEQCFETNTKTFVAESEVVQKYLQDLMLHSLGEGPVSSHKEAFELKNRCIFILEQYQEQPGLLDPHLETWVTPMMNQVYEAIANKGDPHFLLELVYVLCKVRGHKTVLKFFPHEAYHLEPVFEYLTTLTDSAVWQSQYSLLVWLSMVVLVPFDLDSIDSSGNLIPSIITHAKQFMEHTGRPREAAGIMLAKLLTRPDIQSRGFLQEFINWAIEVKNTDQEFLKLGTMFTLVEIFSHGHRSELLSYIPSVASLLETEGNETMFVRQLKVKLAGRLALTQLRPIIASWRYHRGSRSLAAGLQSVSESVKILTNSYQYTVKSKESTQEEDQSGMDEDVNFELLEGQIDALLEGLRDKDNVVRWSAAKAVGRITGRLDQELGDDIVEQVIKLFSPTETDSAWHGGCLALAELARRGLLLTHRLDEVFPLIYQALLYDKKQGNHSIGAHVRDAACYVAWSFARAYAPQDMQKHLHDLARHLLIVALFDREINCRRAASAAFQEHVGRQGSFPHGIDILTEADYFTLGNRNHAYLQVSCFVAQYPEYLHCLIDHLMEVKLKHWDIVIRQLAACALSVLAPFDPNYYLTKVMPKLIPFTVDNNLVVRHGAILGVAEILLSMAGQSAQNNDPKTIEKMIYKHSVNYYLLKSTEELTESEKAVLSDSENRQKFKELYNNIQTKHHLDKISPEMLSSIKEIIFNIEKKRLYRGKGGQIIRSAVCRFIECLAKSEIVLNTREIVKLQETLNDCIMHTAAEIQDASAAAIIEFSQVYHNSPGKALVDKTLLVCIKNLTDFCNNKEVPANISRGSALALGCFSYSLITVNPQKIVTTLVNTTKIKGTESDDAETRKNAARSLGQLVISAVEAKRVPNPGDVSFEGERELQTFDMSLVTSILDCLFSCSEDYSTDKRGDVGSWVRGASMQSILSICKTKVSISEDYWRGVVGVLLRQIVEKIDRLRQIAGDILTTILKNFSLPEWGELLKKTFVENKDYLESFRQHQEKTQKAEELPDQSEMPVQSSTTHYERSNLWSVPNFTYPLVVPLLEMPEFRRDLVRGLVVSVGGITESTVRSSSQELVKFIRKNLGLSWDMLAVYKEREERLHIPFMKTWSILLRDVPELHTQENFGPELMGTTQNIIRGSKDIHKWLACVGVFTGLLDNSGCFKEALRVILGCLGQAFPKVRHLAAQNLYNYLLGVTSHIQICESEEDFNKITSLLIGTSWVLSVKEIRPVRNQIFEILGMEPPKVKVEAKQEETKKEEDESYQSLVREMGY